MILTYKIKHQQDFSRELKLAKKIAKFAIEAFIAHGYVIKWIYKFFNLGESETSK